MVGAEFHPDIFRSDTAPPQVARHAFDPFTIKPLDQAHIDRFERRLGVYRSAIDNTALLDATAELGIEERGAILLGAPSIKEGVFIDDRTHYLRLFCAKFVVSRACEPTSRKMVAEEMERQTGFDFTPFADAAIVRLQNDMAIASNNFHFDVCKDWTLNQTNGILADIFSRIRSRVMDVPYRKPRYIEYAEPNALVSGTLVFANPTKHRRCS